MKPGAASAAKWSHPLLPLKAEKSKWSGGRKLIFFFTDHNMPAILPSKDGNCLIILWIDGGYSMRGWSSEYVRCSKAFKNTMHIVSFLPPPMGGTNNPELVCSLMGPVGVLQGFRAQIYSACLAPEQTNQNTKRRKCQRMTRCPCFTSRQVLVLAFRSWTLSRRGWSSISYWSRWQPPSRGSWM
jgi:hypothetical protein